MIPNKYIHALVMFNNILETFCPNSKPRPKKVSTLEQFHNKQNSNRPSRAPKMRSEGFNKFDFYETISLSWAFLVLSWLNMISQTLQYRPKRLRYASWYAGMTWHPIEYADVP